MKAQGVLLAALALSSVALALAACASDEEGSFTPPVPDSAAPPPDAGSDAPLEEDAGPCLDCEYFPDSCSDDVLCLNGPFGSGGFDPRTQVNAIVGRSANDVWVAGALGAVGHFDGTSWSRSELGAKETLRGLWLRDSSEVSLVSMHRLFSRGASAGADASAGGWSLHDTTTFPAEYGWWERSLISAWAAPGGEWLWGATENLCAAIECLFDKELRTSGVWRLHLSAPDTFEIEDAIPTELCQRISCGNMTAVHGSSASDLWAVGYGGAAIHITDATGATPTVRAFNSQTWDALYGVWAASESEAWAVGTRGIIRRYSGHPSLWDVVADVPTTRDLRAVWGSSPSDVWAVGDGAVVLHYDGKSWSRVKIAGMGTRRPKLGAVWMSSPGHVWIGGQGVVLSLGGKP